MTLTELEAIAERCLKDIRIKTYDYYYGLVLNESRDIDDELRKMVCTYFFYNKADKALRDFYYKEWAEKAEIRMFPHRQNCPDQ